MTLSYLRDAAVRSMRFMGATDLALAVTALGELGFGGSIRKPVAYITPYLCHQANDMSPKGIVDSLAAIVKISHQQAEPVSEMLLNHLVKVFFRKTKRGVHSVVIYISLLEFLVSEIQRRPISAVHWRVFLFTALRSLDLVQDIGHSTSAVLREKHSAAAQALLKVLPSMWDCDHRTWTELRRARGVFGSGGYRSAAPIPRCLSSLIIEYLPDCDASSLSALRQMPHLSVWVDAQLLPQWSVALSNAISLHNVSGGGAFTLTALCALAWDVSAHAPCSCERNQLSQQNATATNCVVCTLGTTVALAATSSISMATTSKSCASHHQATLQSIGQLSIQTAVEALNRFALATIMPGCGILIALRCMGRLSVPTARFVSLEMIRTLPTTSLWTLTLHARRLHSATDAELPGWVQPLLQLDETKCPVTAVSDILTLLLSMLLRTPADGPDSMSLCHDIFATLEWVHCEWLLWCAQISIFESISVASMRALLAVAQPLILHLHATIDAKVDDLGTFALKSVRLVTKIVFSVFAETRWLGDATGSGQLVEVLELLLDALPAVHHSPCPLSQAKSMESAQCSVFGHFAKMITSIVPALTFRPSSEKHIAAVVSFVGLVVRRHADEQDRSVTKLLQFMIATHRATFFVICENVFNSFDVETALLVMRESIEVECCHSWTFLRRCALYFNVHILSHGERSHDVRTGSTRLAALWANYSTGTHILDEQHSQRSITIQFLSTVHVAECSQAIVKLTMSLLSKVGANTLKEAHDVLVSPSWGFLFAKLRSYPSVAPMLDVLNDAIARLHVAPLATDLPVALEVHHFPEPPPPPPSPFLHRQANAADAEEGNLRVTSLGN